VIALTFAAALTPLPWRKWPCSVAISTGRGVVSLNVPLAVDNRALRDLADLRIVDERGSEIPFVLAIHRGTAGARWRETVVDDYGFVPGKYTNAIADAGSPPAHDFTALEISTPNQHFATNVTVLASDDRRTWRIIRNSAPLFNYQDVNLGSNLRIAFPSQHSRWYRVRILDAHDAFPIDGMRLATDSATLPELQRYTTTGQRGRQHGTATIVTIDTRIANLPVSLIRLDTATANFSRDVALEKSGDGLNWSPVGEARLERTPGGDRRTMPIDEAQARYWRVTIENGNDAPLARPAAELWGAPRHVVFSARPEHHYRMLFGNRSAQPPLYDFARTQNPVALENPRPVSAGPVLPNVVPAPAPAVPWSESHPWLLWSALVAAIGTIGGLAARALTIK